MVTCYSFLVWAHSFQLQKLKKGKGKKNSVNLLYKIWKDNTNQQASFINVSLLPPLQRDSSTCVSRQMRAGQVTRGITKFHCLLANGQQQWVYLSLTESRFQVGLLLTQWLNVFISFATLFVFYVIFVKSLISGDINFPLELSQPANPTHGSAPHRLSMCSTLPCSSSATFAAQHSLNKIYGGKKNTLTLHHTVILLKF